MKIKEEYKIKYQELSLTGNIPRHPRFLYEYNLPDDFEEIKEQVYGDETRNGEPYRLYLNNNNELVLASNLTPLVIGYKPENI